MMKIGLYSDSLHDLAFESALDWAAEQGLDAVEIGTGNFSAAPHCNLTELAASADARTRFKAAVEARNLVLSALNFNGHLLYPHPQRDQQSQAVFFQTVQVAIP